MAEGISLRSIAFVACALMSSLTSSPTRAHDLWADGSRIPAWVSNKCCGAADAHRLTFEQIHRVGVAGASTATPTLFPTTASSHPRTDTCGSSMLLTRTATSRLRFASLFRRGACEIVVSAEMRSKRSSRVCVYLHR